MTLLYSDPLFQQHLTGSHPEKPRRLARILEQLEAGGLDMRCTPRMWKPIEPKELARLHGAEYIDEVRKYAAAGGGRIEADTVVSEKSYDAAVLAAGAITDAVRQVIAGTAKNALCLVRPPGHHALAKAPMGFCLFNNIGCGARAAIDDAKLDRVLVIDWDVHHGNGTQDMFWEDDQVAFFSSHRSPFYPGTGAATETGAGKGLGFTRNLPLKFGIEPKEFHAAFQRELTDFCKKIKPQLILISAGFDAHREDPVGSLSLEVEDFTTLSKFVQGLADEYCGGKIVSVLEGGYNIDRTAQSVAPHLTVLREGEKGAGG